MTLSPSIDVVPLEGSSTMLYVKSSPSTSLPSKLISVGPSSFVLVEISWVVGASLTELIIMVTVAVLESSDPSFTLYVKVSSPL